MATKKETRKQRKAFEHYYRMSPRSYKRVAQKFGVCKATVENWGRKYNWQDRLERRNRKEMEKTERILTDKKAQMNAKHIQMAQEAQLKAFDASKHERYHTAKSAVTALEKLINIERVASGEVTERSEVKSDGVVTLENFQAAFDEWRKKKEERKKKEPIVELKKAEL